MPSLSGIGFGRAAVTAPRPTYERTRPPRTRRRPQAGRPCGMLCMARAAPKDGAGAPVRVAQMLVRPRCVILLGRNLPLIRTERRGVVDGAGAQPPSPPPAHLLDVPGRDVDVPPPVFGIVYEAVPPIERLRIMRWRILLINLRHMRREAGANPYGLPSGSAEPIIGGHHMVKSRGGGLLRRPGAPQAADTHGRAQKDLAFSRPS